MTTMRIDWYEATLECLTADIIYWAQYLSNPGDEGVITYGKGRHGYGRSVNFASDEINFTILDHGNGGWPHIIGTGIHAHKTKLISQMAATVGRVSRVDIATDSTEGWEPAERRVLTWADDHPKSTIILVGDFYRQEKGRTYYIGASSSDRRVRVYEKGVQLGENPDWVRVEFQYRPKGKDAKAWTFKATTDEIANSSRAFIALRALEGFYAPPLYERAKREPIFALAEQYGRALQEHVPEAYRLIIEYLRREWTPND